jgi:predicted nuclease with TOPRIM domain
MCPTNIERQTSSSPAPSPINLLQRLAPPQAIIHIGAGIGGGEMHQWRQWDVPHALIIDADGDRLAWTEPLIVDRPDWQVLNVVLAEAEGETIFYRASNPGEDGVIPPERLKPLWPNLHTTVQEPHSTRRLDNLLTETSSVAFEQATPVWTFVDCLPALPILKGAGRHIDEWSVLWLRVLLQPVTETENDAQLESVIAFLEPLGFRCVNVTESNHPAIGYALFVRDWQARIDALTRERDKQAVQTADWQAQIDALTQAYADLNREKDALAKEKSGLAVRHEALEQDVATLTQGRHEQEQRAAEQQAAIDALIQERDSHAAQAADRQAQIDALTQTCADLNGEKDALAKEKSGLAVRHEALEQDVATLTQGRHEQEQRAAEQQAAIDALIQERDSHAAQAADRQAQIDALTQACADLNGEKDALAKEKSGLAARRDALEQDVATLTHGRHEQERLAAEQQARIDALSLERDSHAAQAEDWQAQIDALTQANIELSGERDALAERVGALRTELTALTQSLGQQSQLATDRQTSIDEMTMAIEALKAEIQRLEGVVEEYSTAMQAKDVAAKEKEGHYAKLEAQFAESERRQQSISEEMLRAGAQIDLIKDILVRGEILSKSGGPNEPLLSTGNQQKRLY